ncbi:hypothetical protein KY951_000793 [Vibrio parahaemolyticus]|nr:hypothetical protein [Vibrio parahaemolyticus]EHU5158634.1 hypothetical protein [Vibrio parahaemolyticus]ELA9413167.1 hypothetical protein [Vibrio parahaemolyticus]
MTFRQEYNGCKSFGCPNCGVPDLSLYSRSNQLGYDAWHCPECGAYPPVLINEPILALAHQLQQQTFNLKLLPHCDCRLPAWQRYGRTAVGSPRVKCRYCQKTATLPNPIKESRTLQPLLDALLAEVSPKDLQYKLGLNHRRFSQSLERLASMLDTFSRLYERHLSFSNIQTRSFVQVARSGFRHHDREQRAAHIWTLCSADAQTGYVLLLSDNAWFPQTEMSEHVIPQPLWEQSRYQLTQQEEMPNESDVFLQAQRTYDKILSRSQFDQLAYCDGSHAKSKEVLLTRPVFAAHAHMQNLAKYFANKVPKRFVLEHESFLRGAAITAFTSAIKRGTTQLYYCHIGQSEENLSLNHAKQKMSWWDETWRRGNIQNQYGSWQVGMGWLTPKSARPSESIDELIPTHPNWNSEFWNRYTQWLPPSYAAHLSLQRIKQWQAIYRFLYNYSAIQSPPKVGEDEIDLSRVDSIAESINRSVNAPVHL